MSNVLYKLEENVATITLNRPDVHNAFDENVIAELHTAFTQAEASSARVVVLRGNGKSFCAGGDLGWMHRVSEYTRHENIKDASALGDLLKLIDHLSKPTIALVHGNSFGGGVGLAACCDIVIAETHAQFCLSEVRIGLIPSIIMPYVMRALGARQARRYSLTAERFNAETAQKIGLVHEVSSDPEATLAKIIEALLEGAPAAQTRGKRMILDLDNREITDSIIHRTVEEIADARASAEGKEGLSAFLNKTEPSWRKKR